MIADLMMARAHKATLLRNLRAADRSGDTSRYWHLRRTFARLLEFNLPRLNGHIPTTLERGTR